MKIKFAVLSVVILACLLLLTGNVQAQGFSSILSKLDEIEARLDGLDGGSNVEIVKMEKSIASLKSRVNYLAKSLDEVSASSSSDQTSANFDVLAEERSVISEELRGALSATPSSGMEGLDISGFVDASYFYDANSGSNSFGFDQAEVDIEKTFGEVGSVRVDVEWVSDGVGGFDLDAEQGYVTFKPSVHNSVSFKFGKFNAPIGFELLDAPDMFQFSHALVFDNGLPTNLTGLMVSTQINPTTDLSLYVCNGWRILDGCEVRFEYQDNSEENSDVSFLQMVVGF